MAGAGFALLSAGCGGSAQSTETRRAESAAVATTTVDSKTSAEVAAPSAAKTAIAKAAEADKYLFAFFWKTDDESTAAMRKVFEEAMADLADRADAVAVNVTDAGEKRSSRSTDWSGRPMPLVLAIAPNGAITGGFPRR